LKKLKYNKIDTSIFVNYVILFVIYKLVDVLSKLALSFSFSCENVEYNIPKHSVYKVGIGVHPMALACYCLQKKIRQSIVNYDSPCIRLVSKLIIIQTWIVVSYLIKSVIMLILLMHSSSYRAN